VRAQGLMQSWDMLAAALAFGGVIVMRILAIHRLRRGDGRLWPFLILPSVLLLVFPIAGIALTRRMGLVGLFVAGFLGLDAYILLRPLFKVAKLARTGTVGEVSDALANELGTAMLASVGLGLIVLLVGGVALVIYYALRSGSGT
jgi:hypothetical protein